MEISLLDMARKLNEDVMLLDWRRNYLEKNLSLSEEDIRRYSRKDRIALKYLKNKRPSSKPESVLLTARTKKVKISLTPSVNLSYFLGYLYGDGSVESNGKRINFSDESFEQMVRINRLCEDLFSIGGVIYPRRAVLSKKSAYKLEIRSKVLNSLFSDYFGFPKGKKHNLRIPKEILSDKPLLRHFLIGLFDADGTLPKDPEKCKQLFIDIAMKDKLMVEDIKKSLLFFGVETLKLYPRKSKSPNSDKSCITWELRIRRKSQIENFLREIGFSHPDKGKRAEKLKSFVHL